MKPTTKNIFLTGATGFIGSVLAERLLMNEENHLYLLIRNGQQQTGPAKIRSLAPGLESPWF